MSGAFTGPLKVAVETLLWKKTSEWGETLVHLLKAALNCTMFPDNCNWVVLKSSSRYRHYFEPTARTAAFLLGYHVRPTPVATSLSYDEFYVWRQMGYLLRMWSHCYPDAAFKPQSAETQQQHVMTILWAYVMSCGTADRDESTRRSALRQACTTGPFIACIQHLAQTENNHLAAGLGAEVVWGTVKADKVCDPMQSVAAAHILALPDTHKHQVDMCEHLYELCIAHRVRPASSQQPSQRDQGGVAATATNKGPTESALQAAATSLAWRLASFADGAFDISMLPKLLECIRHLIGVPPTNKVEAGVLEVGAHRFADIGCKGVASLAVDALFSEGTMKLLLKVRAEVGHDVAWYLFSEDGALHGMKPITCADAITWCVRSTSPLGRHIWAVSKARPGHDMQVLIHSMLGSQLVPQVLGGHQIASSPPMMGCPGVMPALWGKWTPAVLDIVSR